MSDAVAHIFRTKTLQDLINYLDDYFFVDYIKRACDDQIREFLKICEQINLPISAKKTYWSTTQLIFLGILLDTVRQMVFVPQEKVDKAIELITAVFEKT